MDRVIELGRLLDYYGGFLTERRLRFARAYADENLSLGEIAEAEGISRQAVRDGIVSAEKQLREMEEKLHLIERSDRVTGLIRAAEKRAEDLPPGEDRAEILRLLKLAVQRMEEDDGI